MNCPLLLEPALSVLFSCPVCVQPYRHPKILPCLHSFCDACLRQELPSQSFTLVCPVCRQQFILPPSGICSLQTNPFVTEFTRLYADSVQNADDEDPIQSDTFYCSSHAGQSLRFYCDDCDSAICSSCTDIEHREHRTMRLENAASHCRDVLQKIIELSKAQFKVVQSVTSQLEGDGQVLDERQVQVLSDIEDSFERLFEGLGSRRQLLHLPLDTLHTSQKGRLGQDAAAYAAKMEQLTAVVDVTQRVLERGNPLHLTLMKKQLDARADLFRPSSSPVHSPMAEPLNRKFDPISLADVKNPELEAVNADGWITELSGPLMEQIHQILPNRPYRICIAVRNPDGESYNSPDMTVTPPKIHARGPLPTEVSVAASPSSGVTKGAPRLASSSQNSLSTHSDHSGVRSTPSPTRRISCPLHNSASSSRVTTPVGNAMKQRKPSFLLSLHVRDQGNCTFESAVTFPQEGHYEVHVTMGEQHVTGSPLKVDVCRPLARKSLECKFMRTDSCRNSTSSRRSTASCKQSDRLSPSPVKPPPAPTEDDLIGRIGCRGRAKGEFTNPQDICCTSTGRILATDSNNQCVQVFTLQGEPRARFGERGRMVGQLQRPTGVAEFPSTNQYVVADYENRWVSIFEPNGKFASRFGMGKLLGPKGLAVDGEGKIYVVDNKASSVCVFQKNGRLVGRFGSRGCTEDHLAGPHFIAINSFGHSVVSDFHNHAVKVFDTTGQFLYSFGSNGEGNGQFNAPTGIAVDAFDNILVADWGNSRVQVFDRHGSFLQTINSESDPLYGPQGLTLTPEGHVLVADSGNHCLKLFKYNNWVTSVSEVD